MMQQTNFVNLNDVLYTDVDIESNKAPLTQLINNSGLFSYIKRVYFYTGIGWCVTLISAELMSLTLTKSNIGILQYVYLAIGFVLTIIGMITSVAPPDIIQEDGNPIDVIPFWKKSAFIGFSYSIGLLISPAVYTVNGFNPIIWPMAIVMTNLIFATMQIFTYTRKNMDGLQFYGPLMSCVSGLIFLGIIEIILACLGFDKIACLLTFGTSIISICVFSGLIYVDTLKAIESYNKLELNTLKCALELVLDMVNILLDIMNILIQILGQSDE